MHQKVHFFTDNTTTIANNSALHGGGLLLSSDSKIFFQPGMAIHLISNSANYSIAAHAIAKQDSSTIDHGIGN